MSSLSSSPLASPARKPPTVNPFAKAMADMEREKPATGDNSGVNPQDASSKLFSDALARTGGQFGDFNYGQPDQSTDNAQNPANNVDWQAEQQRQLEKQQLEAAHKRRHDQINPVDTIDVFNARENQVKKEIDQLRQELKLLATDVIKFEKEVDITLMTQVVNPGQDGKYYISFFQQLRSFIMLLRQKIKSASTWATQMHGKSKKKQRMGMMIGGTGYEKTSTIQDMMHHERSSQYSGG